MELIAFLDAMPWWAWLALAGILLIIEVLAPTTFFLWPALAALAVSGLVALPPHLPWWAQLLTFAGLTVAFGWLGPRVFPHRKVVSDAPLLNRRAEQYLGWTVTVAQEFVEGRGKVRVGDTLWSARAADGSNHPAGTSVVVTSVDGTLLTVEPR
ncbi:MAG: NfeD family protein [Alphaproteobacteria bacterium]